MLVGGLDLLLRWLEQNIFPKWWWIQWWWISNGRKFKKKLKQTQGWGGYRPVSGWLVVWLWLVGGNTFLCGGRRLFGSIDKCTISKHKIFMYIYSIHTRNWTCIPKIAIVFSNYFDPTSNMILLPMTRRVLMMLRFTLVIRLPRSSPTGCTWGPWWPFHTLHPSQPPRQPWMNAMSGARSSFLRLGRHPNCELEVDFFLGGEVGKARWNHLKRPPCFKREEVLFVYGNKKWFLECCFWDPIKFWEWGLTQLSWVFQGWFDSNFWRIYIFYNLGT